MRKLGLSQHGSQTHPCIPLRPRGLRPSAFSCPRGTQPGVTHLPVEEIQDAFGHGGGELEVEFWGGIGVIALCEPGSDEQQERRGSQHASDAHGCSALGTGRRRGMGNCRGQLEKGMGLGQGAGQYGAQRGGIASSSAESPLRREL